ncbi:nucleoporin Nup85-like protein [Melampsora americana]|nr:nucleoporin Nup85-like protein [Melampsora americana]
MDPLQSTSTSTSNPISIQIHPKLIKKENLNQHQSIQTNWDKKRNGFGLSIISSSLSTKKSNQKLSISEQSIYLINSFKLNSSRRSLITRSFEIFSSLQKVVAVCEEEDHFKNQNQLPSSSQFKYYSRIAHQYVISLKDYLNQLEQEDEESNTDEIDLVIQMIETLSLFILVFIPEDGRGDGIFSEQFLDWVNRINPQPPKEEGEELSKLSLPYEHVNFWPYIHACLIRGHLTQSTALLKPYTKTQNPTLNQLMIVTISLINSTPRSTKFSHEHDFIQSLYQFRQSVDRLLSNLDQEMKMIFQLEEERKRLGKESMDEDDLLYLQASLKICFEILSGDENRVSEACYDWKEALAAHLLWVYPTCRRDGLGPVIKTVTENWPIDQTSITDRLTSSILTGSTKSLITEAHSLSSWLSCHLIDLISKIGILDPEEEGEEMKMRDFYVMEYIDDLSLDQGLWRLMIAYLDTTSFGINWIRSILRRLVIDDSIDNPSGEEDGNGSMKKATVSVLEFKEVCERFGLEDEFCRCTKILTKRLVKERKYGAAIAYCVRSGELNMITRITNLLLMEYINEGPEEFAKLVDEIPSSLLHPIAPKLRPNLFLTNHRSPSSLNLLEEGEEEAQEMESNQTFNNSLIFLSRYRDLHSFYSKGNKSKVIEIIMNLLINKIAPKEWWCILLIDLLPLLEDEEMLVNVTDTYELLRCLEEITSLDQEEFIEPKQMDYLMYLKLVVGNQSNGLKELEIVRYSLARNLSKCLTFKY